MSTKKKNCTASMTTDQVNAVNASRAVIAAATEEFTEIVGRAALSLHGVICDEIAGLRAGGLKDGVIFEALGDQLDGLVDRSVFTKATREMGIKCRATRKDKGVKRTEDKVADKVVTASTLAADVVMYGGKKKKKVKTERTPLTPAQIMAAIEELDSDGKVEIYEFVDALRSA